MNGDDLISLEKGKKIPTQYISADVAYDMARKAAEEMRIQTLKEIEGDEDINVVNPRVVKQLKDTVQVFSTLRELSSNPIQQAIEKSVGEIAASAVSNAFTPRTSPQKKDIIDTFLNSQFAYGLGEGIGQRSPELIKSMADTFGKEKAGQMIDNVLGKSEEKSQIQKSEKISEKELLLSLDPNNPEHVSAYADSQGGISVEVARKMLMIHQDDIIKQMKSQGVDVQQISMSRGSQVEQFTKIMPLQPTTDVKNPSMDNIPVQSNDQKNQKEKQYFEVMGEVLDRLENLNNNMFSLQKEIDTIKRSVPQKELFVEEGQTKEEFRKEDFTEQKLTKKSNPIKIDNVHKITPSFKSDVNKKIDI